MGKSTAYFPAIDGLRLLASLNIVFLHLSSSSAFNYANHIEWLTPIVNGPAFSAGLFFVLAGFLFGSKFSDPTRRIAVVPFMFSRIAKLYRLHFFCTILMFLAIAFKLSGIQSVSLADPKSLLESLGGGISQMEHPFRSLFLHLTLLWSLVPEWGMKLNEPSWALTGFFICYALTPAISKWLFRIQNIKWLWALFFLVFVPGVLQGVFFGWHTFQNASDYAVRYRFFHMFPAMHIGEYFWGMIMFILYQKGQFKILEKNYVAGFCQAFLLAAVYIVCVTKNNIQIPALYFIVSHSALIFTSGLLILSLIPSKGFLARFFCIPFVRLVGRSSFYPYLMHLPFITIGWGFCNMDTPRATLILILVLYSFSTLYLSFKNYRRKKLKQRKQTLA